MQSILDHRQDLEDKEKEKLGKVLQKLEEAKQFLMALEQKRIDTAQELKDKQKQGGVDVNELMRFNRFLKKLDQDILNARLMIEQIKAEEREQRARLLKAAQDRQAFEKIKEKHKEEFDAEEADKERKLIDELASIKFARRIMEENEKAQAEENGEAVED